MLHIFQFNCCSEEQEEKVDFAILNADVTSILSLDAGDQLRDKETLNKLRVRSILDFTRRAINCTIMVSYISLLLTVRKTQRANEIFLHLQIAAR